MLHLVLMASALEGPSWKCWHWLHQTREVSGSFSWEHPHPATKSSPINQALMWLPGDTRQTEPAVCHDKNPPSDQLPLSSWGAAKRQLWLLYLEHCWACRRKLRSISLTLHPQHASAKSFLQRWAHVNSAEALPCRVSWALDCREPQLNSAGSVCEPLCPPLAWGAKLKHH